MHYSGLSRRDHQNERKWNGSDCPKVIQNDLSCMECDSAILHPDNQFLALSPGEFLALLRHSRMPTCLPKRS
jgi:hypothetical protein